MIQDDTVEEKCQSIADGSVDVFDNISGVHLDQWDSEKSGSDVPGVTSNQRIQSSMLTTSGTGTEPNSEIDLWEYIVEEEEYDW